jgi:hypothetical protein
VGFETATPANRAAADLRLILANILVRRIFKYDSKMDKSVLYYKNHYITGNGRSAAVQKAWFNEHIENPWKRLKERDNLRDVDADLMIILK